MMMKVSWRMPFFQSLAPGDAEWVALAPTSLDEEGLFFCVGGFFFPLPMLMAPGDGLVTTAPRSNPDPDAPMSTDPVCIATWNFVVLCVLVDSGTARRLLAMLGATLFSAMAVLNAAMKTLLLPPPDGDDFSEENCLMSLCACSALPTLSSTMS